MKELKKGEKIIQFSNPNGQICVLTDKNRILCQKPVYEQCVDNFGNQINSPQVSGYQGFFEIK